MKKILLFFVMGLASLSSWAYDFEANGLYYEVDLKTMTACVKSGEKKYSGDIVIPETFTVSGRTFTITGIDGFRETDVNTVQLASTIETISDYCFYGCKQLTEIDTKNAVTIGKSAYENCIGAKKLILGESVLTIKDRAFYGCTELCSIYYNAENAQRLEENNSTFVNTGKEMDLFIGNKVKWIPDYLFGEDSGASFSPINIKNIFFESGSVCEKIGYRAFLRCSSLSYIEIPPSLTNINSWAFLRSVNVEKVMISDLKAWMNIDFSDRSNPINPSGDDEKPADLYLNGKKLDTIIIPEGTVIKGRSPIPGYYKKVVIPEDFTFSSSSIYMYFECDSLIIKGGWDDKKGKYTYAQNTWRAVVNDYLEIPQDMSAASVQNFVKEASSSYSSKREDIYFEVPTKTISIACNGTIVKGIFSSKTESSSSYSSSTYYHYAGATPHKIILRETVDSFDYLNFSAATNLQEIECHSLVPPSADGTIFSKNQLIYTKLYVPKTAIEAYKTAEVWQDFWNIEAFEEADDDPQEVEIKQCAAPTIDYEGGKLIFNSKTPNSSYHYSVSTKSTVNGAYSEGESVFALEFTISAYATAEGYEPSETVTKIISIDHLYGDVDGNGEVNISDVTKLIDEILQIKSF